MPLPSILPEPLILSIAMTRSFPRHSVRTALLLTLLFVPRIAAAQSADTSAGALSDAADADVPRRLQQQAVVENRAEFGYWGTAPETYTGWKSHSNRLIPVYTFGTKGSGTGIDLESWCNENSPYRSEAQLARIYGFVPEETVNPEATWMDQTNVADLQRAAIAAGRKYVFLVVFDGMDWQTTCAAATYRTGKVTYREGRGHGNHFQDYDAHGTSQFGYMCTAPHNEGTDVDPNMQTVLNPGGKTRGGYDGRSGGMTPWSPLASSEYLIAKPAEGQPLHAYTDSAPSASSMTSGVKTFNGSINVDPTGGQVSTIAAEVQEKGFAVGAVSSVPISHATPAAACSHNVERDDYQDLTRDMLGLPSISHPDTPLPGLDVVIGGGYGVTGATGKNQGDNYVPGNVYLTDEDLKRSDIRHGGRYVTAVRTEGRKGAELLAEAADRAVAGRHRLLGFFGMGSYNGHLPFATADGHYDPVPGVGKKAESYTETDRLENPTLAEMTSAAIRVLSTREEGFWLLVEPGDVDWANHDDNIDNSIGAVISGDAAVKVITDWVEANSNWSESLLIVTADHGHMLNLSHPELLVEK